MTRFSPKGTLLVTTSKDRGVTVWNTESGAIIRHLETPHKKNISALAISTDESLIATGFEDGSFNLWEISTGRLLQSSKNHMRSISAITIFSDNDFLILGYNDGLIEIWNIKTNKTKHTWSGHGEPITHLSVTQDNKIISVSAYENEKIWSLEGNLVQHFQLPDNEKSIHLSSDGKKIVSDAHWGKIHVWDVESGDLLNTIEIQEDLFLSNISDDGNHLVLQYLDGIFEVWDLSTNVLEHQLNIQPFSTYSISIGPDGKKIATTSLDGEIHIWDTSMSPSRLLLNDSEKDSQDSHTALSGGPTSKDIGLSIDSNGTTIATGNANQNIWIWNIQDGKVLNYFLITPDFRFGQQ